MGLFSKKKKNQEKELEQNLQDTVPNNTSNSQVDTINQEEQNNEDFQDNENYQKDNNKSFRQKIRHKKYRNIVIGVIALGLVCLTLIIGRNNASFIISALIMVIAFTAIILNKYPNRDVFTVDSYITVALGLFFVSSVICILPLDASTNISYNNQLIELGYKPETTPIDQNPPVDDQQNPTDDQNQQPQQQDQNNDIVQRILEEDWNYIGDKYYQNQLIQNHNFALVETESQNQIQILQIQQDIKQNQDNFKIFWILVYWSILFLGGLYNFQNYFHSQGHIRFKSRLCATVKILVILGLIGIVALVGLYLLIVYAFKKDGFEYVNAVILVGLQIYGVSILVVLLGYGIVHVPIFFWLLGNSQKQLQIIIVTAEQRYKDYREKRSELMVASEMMQSLIDKIPVSHSLFDYKQQLQSEIPDMQDIKEGNSMREQKKRAQNSKKTKEEKMYDMLSGVTEITENSIADGRYILLRKRLDYMTSFNKWKKHMDQFYKLVDIESLENVIEKQKQERASRRINNINKYQLDEQTNKKNKKDKKDKKNKKEKKDKKDKKKKNEKIEDIKQISIEQDSIEIEENQIGLKHINKRPLYVWTYRILAFFSLCFSFLVLWSESVLAFKDRSRFILLADIVSRSQNIAGVLTFIVLVQCYIIFCLLFTLSQLDLGEIYASYPGHTHHLSLIFGVQTCGTIVFALCYNVMMVFGQISINNTFKEGELNLTSGFNTFFLPLKNVPFFGTYYNRVVAILIAVVGILSLFSGLRKLFQKVVKKNDIYKDGAMKVEDGDLKIGTDLLIKEFVKTKEKKYIEDLLKKRNKKGNKNQDIEMQFKNNNSDANMIINSTEGSPSKNNTNVQNSFNNINLQSAEQIEKQNQLYMEEVELDLQKIESGQLTDELQISNEEFMKQQLEKEEQLKKEQEKAEELEKLEFQQNQNKSKEEKKEKKDKKKDKKQKKSSDNDDDDNDNQSLKVQQQKSSENISNVSNKSQDKKQVQQMKEQQDKPIEFNKKEMSGIVYKKPSSKLARKMKGWSKKIMEFSDNYLYYWDENQTKQSEQTHISKIQKVVLYKDDLKKDNNDKEDNTVFNIYTENRDYKLHTDSEQETTKWVQFLNYQIDKYQGNL